MASNLKDDEERDRRVELIGEYRLQTGESTRNIAKYFKETQFPISNFIVVDYLNRYKKKHPEAKAIIDAQTYAKTPDSIKKPEVRERVLKVAKLIKAGFTIEEIANTLNEPYWVIYIDIKNRLPMVDKKLSDEIRSILKERSLGNLKNHEKHAK